MALAPLKKCNHPGCGTLVRTPRCDKHKKQKHTRTTSKGYQHLYGYWWRKQSKLFKQRNPLCVTCLADGKVKAAYCVDHIVPHKGDELKFRDINNWQSLCERCHNKKTAKGL